MPIPTAACDTNTTCLLLGQGCSNLLPFRRCFQLSHWTLFCINLQEIKTSALSCQIPSESIWIQGSDFLNCVILPEKMLDSDPEKKNVFSTIQCHISLFINCFLILITQKVVSEQLTTSTALALMLLRWWKACPVATPERFNILYFHKSWRLHEKSTVCNVTRAPVKPHRFFWFLSFKELQFSEVVTCVSKFSRE